MTHAGFKGKCFLELKSVLLEVGYIKKWPKFAYLKLKILHLKFRVMRDRVYAYFRILSQPAENFSGSLTPSAVYFVSDVKDRYHAHNRALHFNFKNKRSDPVLLSAEQCDWEVYTTSHSFQKHHVLAHSDSCLLASRTPCHTSCSSILKRCLMTT